MIEAVFLGTIIPLLFLIIILKGENRLMMVFFTWGLVAFVLSLNVNNAVMVYFKIDNAALSVTWAPVVEEFFKAIPLVFFFVNKKERNFPVVFFAMASGIGFSIQENYLYLQSILGLQASPVFYIILRSVTASLMHGISTAMVGYGIMLLKNLKVMKLPLLYGLFSLAVILHSLFNTYINSSLRFVGMLMPAILYLIGLVILLPDEVSSD